MSPMCGVRPHFHRASVSWSVRTKLFVDETTSDRRHGMSTSGTGRGARYIAATIVLVVLLIAAAVIASPRGVTNPIPPSTAPPATSIPPRNTTSVNTTAGQSFPGCPTKVPTPWFGDLTVGGTPATICFQIYEFNSTSIIALNTTKLFSITGYPVPNGGSVFSGKTNFTVSPSVAQIFLGGPNSTNEGAIIAYSISAKPGLSGTYFMQLAGFLLGDSPGELCTGGAGQLVAGNGQPNYALPGSCILEGSTGPYSIPGVGYKVPGNTLYYRIYGAGNSTV